MQHSRLDTTMAVVPKVANTSQIYHTKFCLSFEILYGFTSLGLKKLSLRRYNLINRPGWYIILAYCRYISIWCLKNQDMSAEKCQRYV